MNNTLKFTLIMLIFTIPIFSVEKNNASLDEIINKNPIREESDLESLSTKLKDYPYEKVFAYIDSIIISLSQEVVESKRGRNAYYILSSYMQTLTLPELAEAYEAYTSERDTESLRTFSAFLFWTAKDVYWDSVHKERGQNLDVNNITKLHPIFVSDFLYFQPRFFHTLLFLTGNSNLSPDKEQETKLDEILPYFDAIFLRKIKRVQPSDPKLEEVIEGEIPQEAIARHQEFVELDS